jgi:ABC-type Fe3+/spermidine/putrescine transport system ATPase subunit
MDVGRIAQLGSPAEIYRRPLTPFVAGFVGNTNLVDATVLGGSADGGVRLRLLGQEVEVLDVTGRAPGEQVSVGIRPDDIRLVHERERDRHPYVFEAQVRRVSFVGEVVQIEAELAGARLRLHAMGPGRFELLERPPETVLFTPGSLIVMPAGVDGGR